MRICLALLALVAVLASVGRAGVLRGRVLDGDGHPVAGVVVATSWHFADPEGDEQDEPPRPDDGARVAHTDAEGAFSLETGPWSTVLALDLDHDRGATASVDSKSTGAGPVTVTLAPLVPVKGSFDVKAAGDPPGLIGAWFAPKTSPYPIASCLTASRTFGLALPRGDYQLFYSTDLLDHHRWTSCPPGRASRSRSRSCSTRPARRSSATAAGVPTCVLIDPDGKLVRSGSEEMLVEVLESGQ